MMTDAIHDLVRQATVKVCNSWGNAVGSAVFIHQGHLLTAAHVIDRAGPSPFVETCDGKQLRHLRAVAMAPAEKIPGAKNWPLPDLAVLKVVDEELGSHPCVLLTDEMPEGGKFVASGYTQGIAAEVVLDRSPLEFEASRKEEGATLLKFGGEISSGMSGGPVVDVESGRVVGILKADRGGGRSSGGFAVSGASILDSLPEHWASNLAFHRVDPTWRVAVDTGRAPTIDRAVVERYLEVTQEALSQSPLLPPEVSTDDLRQPVRLRSKRFEGGRGNSATGSDIDMDDQGQTSLGSAFIWDPLRSPWQSVAVVAGPGMGKSWLIAYHVRALAGQQLTQMADQPELHSETKIPVWVEAASLARHLEASPTRTDAIKAVAAATHLMIRALDPAELEVLIALAINSDRLILCVDGLDEVPSDLRARLATALGLLGPDLAQFVITTREAAGQLLEDVFAGEFEEFSIEGFTEGDVRRFVDAWYRHQPGESENVRAAIRSTPNLKPLTRTPLLLNFICRLAGSTEESSLPATRSRLYREVALNLLSGRWRESESRRAEAVSSDPLVRLRVLARAVGSLASGWRDRPEEFYWSDIESLLREDDEYDKVERGAEERWDKLHQSLSPDREPKAKPSSLALWEFEHDGLLVQATSHGRTTLRFSHLVFAELCIAISLAEADVDEQTRLLETHRWFDDEWNDIVPIACGVSEDPVGLLGVVANVPADPWMIQARLEARAMAEAPDEVPPELLEKLVDRVIASLNGNLRTDLGRCLETLKILIESDVGDARRRVREVVETETLRWEEDDLSLLVYLCRVRDEYGMRRCAEIAEDRKLPEAKRLQAMVGLCATDEPALLRLAVGAAGTTLSSGLASLLSALVHGDAAAIEVALDLVRDKKFDLDFRAGIAVSLIDAGAGDTAAEALLADPRTNRTVRARAVSALLRTGHHVSAEESAALAADPNVIAEDRLELVHALLLRGDWSVLGAAAEVVVDSRLDYLKRRALARTMLSIGALGRQALVREVLSGRLTGASRVQAFLALIERREQEVIGEVRDLIDDPAQPAWVRSELSVALMRSMPDAVEPKSIVDLVDAAEISDGELRQAWENLLVHMLISGISPLVAAAEARVLRVFGVDDGHRDPTADDFPVPSNLQVDALCQGLGQAGRKGVEILIKIIGSSGAELDTRILAAQILAQTNTAPGTLQRLLDDESISEAVRERLVVLFAMLGATVTFERLLTLLPESEPAYAALYTLLSASGTTEAMIQQGVRAGAAAVSHLTDAALPEWEVDFVKLIGGLEIDGRSDTELKLRRDWAVRTLRNRVYARLLTLLLPAEKRELHRVGNFVDNEATRNWLATRIPSYVEIADTELARLTQEIAEDPSILPSLDENVDPFTTVSVVASLLREWFLANVNDDWDKGLAIMAKNESVFESPLARDVFDIIIGLKSDSLELAAHAYMLDLLRRRSAGSVAASIGEITPLLELLREHVDAGEGAATCAAAAIGLMRWPTEAAVQFYAAVGAELEGNAELADALMTESAENASVNQATQGRKSLQGWRDQHELDPDRIERLREILGGAIERANGGQIPEEAGTRDEDDEEDPIPA